MDTVPFNYSDGKGRLLFCGNFEINDFLGKLIDRVSCVTSVMRFVSFARYQLVLATATQKKKKHGLLNFPKRVLQASVIVFVFGFCIEPLKFNFSLYRNKIYN